MEKLIQNTKLKNKLIFFKMQNENIEIVDDFNLDDFVPNNLFLKIKARHFKLKILNY
jgi:hypothetical protein